MRASSPDEQNHTPENTHNLFECSLTGTFEPHAFRNLLRLFESKGFRVIHNSTREDSKVNALGENLLVEIGKSDSEVFDLVEKLMQTGLVKEIEFSPTSRCSERGSEA